MTNVFSGAPGQLTADNITVFTVPEPGTLFAMLILTTIATVRPRRG